MAIVDNVTFASPLADANYAHMASSSRFDGLLATLSELSGWTIAMTLLALMVAYDQCSYLWQKGSIPGPAWKIPFIGPFLESVNPKFEEYKAKWASGELSCVSVFHKFVVIASTRDMSRKVFNSPGFVKPCVVDAAHKLLGKTNWVFLDGKAHVDFRKGLNGLFTRKALETYLPGQDDVYNDYFERFLKVTEDAGGKPVPYMAEFREVMCAVSCRTFVGYYISDEAIKKIADDYYNITAALELVNFPIMIPFTKTWYGKKAADMVLEEFAKCAAKSKVRMAAGGDITCIMDGWVKAQLDSAKYRERQEKGLSLEGIEKPSPMLRDFTDYEISQTVFTFLFASQDATSSAATWLFQTMAQRPDVLDKVREENLRVRGGDRNKPATMDILDEMVYTRAAVKELLRYRPPVLMVPYLAKKAFPITDTYTVPKGAMIIPTVYPALRDPEIYTNPDLYDPDRYVTGDAEIKGAKNFLVFGTGPHYCLGQVYAQLNLALMIGKAAMHLDWVHHPTPLSEEIKVFATIFPMVSGYKYASPIHPTADAIQDDCPLTFSRRP
ncbi:cytochrome P450 [Cadophora sp. MPI-SDFR-AT-0126]|nr:cytochrome P450 [Leotiomycetes sp. MPI-SDFR-AT-0126]